MSTKLLVEGGGDMPRTAAKLFYEWTKECGTTILLIPWASELPIVEIEENFRTWGCGYFPEDLELRLSPTKGEMESDSECVEKFYVYLRECSSVFFAGGDQNKIIDLFDAVTGLKAAIQSRYYEGCPFGGTSAGAAIMSHTMITGEGDFDVIDHRKVAVKVGLGLLSNAVIDQHFIKRKRLNRLLSVMTDPSRTEPYAIGIDEDCAVAIIGGRDAEVLGPEDGKVVFLERELHTEAMSIKVLSAGCRFSLVR